MQALLEEIRCSAAVLLGLCDTVDAAHTGRPASPKIAMVAPPAHYETGDGRHVGSDEVDLLARAISM
ncbi:MAG: hypothetical protein IIC20_09200, partial [Chloroflexi bacterium]|nr:hypothetical protein [Chloroflexota bacterium]